MYVVPQGDGFMRWDAPCWSEVLFSSRNGLFHWAPSHALAALGLVAACARRGRLAGLLLVGVGLQAVVNGAAWDWWGGGSFGGRRFDSCYAAFAIGLGAVLAPGAHALATIARRPRWARAALALATAPVAALAVALAIANVGLAIHYDSTTARIYGGDRAANVFRIHLKQGVRKRAGRVAARASVIATWPGCRGRSATAWSTCRASPASCAPRGRPRRCWCRSTARAASPSPCGSATPTAPPCGRGGTSGWSPPRRSAPRRARSPGPPRRWCAGATS